MIAHPDPTRPDPSHVCSPRHVFQATRFGQQEPSRRAYHSPSSSAAGRTCCSIDRTPAASAAAAVVIEDQY
uniref:Uncharacterized protein n=1 Tax=Oryza nivara TaxID=4536 RepID=A0A0E0ISQ7_ORYNI